jgi:aryl-alcohol dehydrogenase (NADP+)
VCAFRQAARELGVPGPVTTQNSYSLVSRGADGDLVEVLFRENMSLLAYSPLAGGLLTGKYAGGAQPAEARYTLFDGVGLRYRRPIVHEAVEAYRAVAQERGLSLAQLALGYVRSRWYVGATIIGATTLAQLEEDIAAAQIDLDAEALADIAAVQVRYPNPAT